MINPRELVWYAGGETFVRYGVLIRRTMPGEEDPEVFTRPTTKTYTDRDGQTRTAGVDVLPPDWRDLDGDGVLETPVAVFHPDASGSAGYRVSPSARTGYLRFVQPATIASGDTLIYVGDATLTGPRFYVEWDGANWRVVYHDGASSVGSVADFEAPAAGQEVELLWVHGADGRVRLEQAIDGGVVRRGAASAALAMPSAWGARVRHISEKGDGSGSGHVDLVADKEALGVYGWVDMRGVR